MNKPKNIDRTAQLIEGVGASSWFTVKSEGELFRIERFSLKGKLECSRLFKSEPNNFEISSKYEFTYISHCKECKILQNNVQKA